jgi:hypothetical protein
MRLVRTLVVAAGAGMFAGCTAVDSDSNHAPVVQPAAVTLDEDWPGELTIYAEDVDGDDLELTMYSAWGGTYDLRSITQTTRYGINRLEAEVDLRGWPDFHGESDFKVWVSDGIERTTATVTVTILPVNDKPTARGDAFATEPGTELVIASSTLLANDDDQADVLDDDALPNVGLVVESVGLATHGTASFVAGQIRFMPDASFSGTAPFTYRVTDGEDSVEATVRVLVGGNNAAPIVVEDMAQTMEGVAVDIEAGQMLRNDLDDDGHTLSVIAVGNPEHGTVVLKDRMITFQPKGDNGGTFFGLARFEYTVTDGAATATGHVVVEVAPWI